ncbi:MAG TPA: poly-gamma-glutamate synthase PgsB [Candidatus Brocadiia bacterium]
MACPIIYGIIEYYLHNRNLRRIPIRIHVNGTRGKSSVTRLIAGGLRAGGIKTLAKTTGSSPRIIYEDGQEEEIPRQRNPTIKEQMKVISLALQRRVESLVIECMALKPELQLISEHKIIRSNMGVITNVRADHLDIMGPTTSDVARAISSTIPEHGKLFTSEKEHLPLIGKIANEHNTELFVINSDDISQISEESMQGFPYLEHKENVALALKVCQALGVNPQVALKGMYSATPDVGVLKIHRIHTKSPRKLMHFVNAFAANDPDSNTIIWQMVKDRFPVAIPKILVLNTRGDRLQRSQQLGKLICNGLSARWYILVGQSTRVLETTALRHGIDPCKIIKMDKERCVSIVFEKMLQLTECESVIVGMGNIDGIGNEIATHFERLGSRN